MTRPDAIIGIGSPFGWDRVGWLVVEVLQRDERCRGSALLALDRPGPALLDAMRGYAAVVLVDAMRDAGGDPGNVREIAARDLAADAAHSHGLDVGVALGLGAALGTLPRSVRILGVSVARGDPADGEVEALAVRVAPAVAALSAVPHPASEAESAADRQGSER